MNASLMLTSFFDPEIWGKAGIAGLSVLAILILVIAFLKSQARKDELFTSNLSEGRNEERAERASMRADHKESHAQFASAMDNLAESVRGNGHKE